MGPDVTSVVESTIEMYVADWLALSGSAELQLFSVTSNICECH
jgi:hypothetical protein